MYRITRTLLVLPLLSGAAFAQITFADIQLQMRANSVNPDGFNVPDFSSINSATVALNDSRQVAIEVITVAGDTDQTGIWLGQNGMGEIVDLLPLNFGASDVAIINGGKVFWHESDIFATNGIQVYDPATDMTTQAVGVGGEFGITDFGTPRVTNDEFVAFRGETGGTRALLGVAANGDQTRYATQTGSNAFLFNPDVNGNEQLASKVDVNNFDIEEIRLYDADGTFTVIAQNQALDAASPYEDFDNGLSVNDSGQVAFTADTTDGDRGVFLSDGTATIIIAMESDPEISEISFFRPVANNLGEVVFRGVDATGADGVFVGNGTELVPVVTRFDTVQTDLGLGMIDQNNPGDVAFGGGVDINDNGDVAFMAALTPAGDNQTEWGSGVFVAERAIADCPNDPDGSLCDTDIAPLETGGDCIVNNQDLGALLASYLATDADGNFQPAADFNDDNVVNNTDLGQLLADYLNDCN